MIELTTADGATIGAYEATPEGPAKGGLVVLQEIFGVNAHMRHVADAFAQKGYRVIVPALFDRIERGVELTYVEPDTSRGRELRAAVSDDAAVRDVEAAVKALAAHGKVGIVGYCWGGYVAWLAGTRLEGVAAVVAYYGGGIGNVAGEQPKAPVLLHYGEKDHAIPMTEVETVRGAHPEIPLHTYDAGHGFSCEARPSYEPKSAALAEERTLAFLAEHLG